MRFWTFDKASLETTLMTPRLKLATRCSLPWRMEGAGNCRSKRPASAFRVRASYSLPSHKSRWWRHIAAALGTGKQIGLCNVALPEGINPTSLQPVDLCGRPVGEKIKVTKNRFEVNAKAWVPMSFVIES